MSHSRFLTSVHPATVLIRCDGGSALVERVESAGSVCESNAQATSKMPPAGLEDHKVCSDRFGKRLERF
jgi:hypothetical protein